MHYFTLNLFRYQLRYIQSSTSWSHKRDDFRKKSYWTQNVSCDFLCTFVRNIFHSKKNWARYDRKRILVGLLQVKYRIFLSGFNETWTFSKDCRKVSKYQISWKSVQWEPSCSCGRTDEHEDTTKLTGAFRNFANVPKMVDWCTE
jgi:hypothetical protein